MKPDGTDIRRLTRPIHAYFPVGPKWSPDGKRIAFIGECVEPRLDLCLMNADGSGVRTVATLVAYAPPTWSPDGIHLAFTRPAIANGVAVEGDVAIWTISADGTGEATLVENAERRTWSPDGSRIAFVSGRDGTTRIYVVNLDGTGLTRISDGPLDGSPAWSPDGRRIAFSSGRAGKPEFLSDYAREVQASGRDPIYADPGRPVRPAEDIYTMQADGTGVARLTEDPSDNGDPAWSPDGSRIVFSSVRDGDYDLYVMNTDGTDVSRLTDIPQSDADPSWTATASS